MKIYLKKDYYHLFILFSFLIIGWFKYTIDLDYFNVVTGFSPDEWLKIKDNIIFKINDFPTGMDPYYSSYFMHFYNFLFNIFNIDGLSLTKSIVAIELIMKIATSFVMVTFIFKNLDDNIKKLVFFILSLYFINSYAFMGDISRFGNPFYIGLFYNIADSFRLMAIVLFLNRNFKVSALLLGLSFLTHPIYAFIAGIFILSSFVINIKKYSKNDYYNILIALIIFGIFLIIWYLNINNNEYLKVEEYVPQSDWFYWSLFGNMHWYPIEFGTFTVFHQERFITFLSILLMFLYVIYNKKELTIIDKQIIYGQAAMIILIVIAVYFSWSKDSMLMIKLNLTRASLLFIEISLLYLLVYFIKNIFDNNISSFRKTIYIVAVISPFLSKGSLPVIIPLILISLDILYFILKKKNISNKKIFKMTLVLVVIFLLLILFYYSNNYIIPKFLDRYFGINYLWIIFCSIFLSFFFFNYFLKRTNNDIKKDYLSICILILISLFSYYWSYNYNFMNSKKIENAKYYKDVQLWSNQNTEKEALFLLDPTLGSGWRLYSERVSFGTLREWTHNSWLYKSDYKVFKEGMNRLGEFDLDLNDKKYDIKPIVRHLRVLTKDIQDKFYSFDEKWFDNMSIKYGIDYILMKKNKIKEELNYKKVYENKYYLLYETSVNND